MNEDRNTIVPLQLGLLQLSTDQTIQQAFEQFGRDAVSQLTVDDASGNPVFEAGKAKASFTLKVRIERVANDSYAFAVEPIVRTELPRIPGRARSTTFTTDNGLVQRVTVKQLPLFDPASGQPKVPTSAEVDPESL